MAAGISLRRRTLGTALSVEVLEGAANLRRRDWLAQKPGWTGPADWPGHTHSELGESANCMFDWETPGFSAGGSERRAPEWESS